jgi:DNA-binding CsgD family transcriptional regulator
MEGVRGSDLRAVLEFVELAWARAGEHAFPLETLEALATVIPCDSVGYCELDRLDRRVLEYVGTDDDDGGNDDLFWDIIGEHPLCQYQQAYADFSAKRLSDVISPRQLHQSRVYAEWFRPYRIGAELEVGIVRARTRTRNFVFERADGDFSDRDVAVLGLIAPHLARIHEATQLRKAAGATDPGKLARLTTREAEVLELVAAGLANVAIAERLWISPGTVKKHLDNVYAKLEVGNRTAAVAQLKAQPE